MTIDRITHPAVGWAAPSRRVWRPVARAVRRSRAIPAEVKSAALGQYATAGSTLQLTARGLALIVGLFLALFLTSAVVVVTAFFAIPDEPAGVVDPADTSAVVLSVG
jgi:hypothetical protein